MKNTKDTKDIQKIVIELLSQNKSGFGYIEKMTGISRKSISRIHTGATPNPGFKGLKKLYDFLTRDPMDDYREDDEEEA